MAFKLDLRGPKLIPRWIRTEKGTQFAEYFHWPAISHAALTPRRWIDFFGWISNFVQNSNVSQVHAALATRNSAIPDAVRWFFSSRSFLIRRAINQPRFRDTYVSNVSYVRAPWETRAEHDRFRFWVSMFSLNHYDLLSFVFFQRRNPFVKLFHSILRLRNFGIRKFAK